MSETTAIVELARRYRDIGARWKDSEADPESITQEEDRALDALVAAPVGTSADAITTMRVVLDDLPLSYPDELKGHRKVADELLRKVLKWLESEDQR